VWDVQKKVVRPQVNLRAVKLKGHPIPGVVLLTVVLEINVRLVKQCTEILLARWYAMTALRALLAYIRFQFKSFFRTGRMIFR
jgi:hypothetical protein